MDSLEIIKELKQALKESEKYTDPCQPPKVGKTSYYIWIGTKDGKIGNENCHYELMIEEEKAYIDIHFETEDSSKFKDLSPEYHYDWESDGSGHQAIRLHSKGIKLTDPDIIAKIFKELDYNEKELGERIRNMLNDKETEYLEQLKANHNIVLNGAPGTGKTFTAKRIAERLISEPRVRNTETNTNPLNILKALLKNYKPDTNQINKDSEALKNFQKEYPKNDIKNLTLEDYCLGTGEQGGFCWYIEKKLRDQSIYFPAQRGAYVYGIFKGKDGVYKSKQNLSGSDDEKLEKVLLCISECVNNYNNLEKLEKERKKGYVDSGYLLKILNSYYPEQFIQINSKTHLENIVKLFSLSCSNKKSIFYLERSVYKFYEKLKKDLNVKISPIEFMRLLYSNFNIKNGELNKDGSSSEIDLHGTWKLIQFHQSYDYTDFVEGLRPISNEDDSSIPKFDRKNGIFKDFCELAVNNPNKNFVFIIDEINRGEVSKIFGELFFSIDPGYRGREGLIQTQYQNLIDENSYDVFKDGFFVPDNVYIIGTMNDIDRSVESMDFAFRRRFNWIEVTAKESQKMFETQKAWKKQNGEITNIPDNIQDIIIRMDKLNAEIEKPEYELGREYQIGAAYFLKYTTYLKDQSDESKKKAFSDLWKYNLEPLIKEYIRGTGIDINKFKNAYDGIY